MPRTYSTPNPDFHRSQHLDPLSATVKKHIFFGLMKTFRREYIVMCFLLVLKVTALHPDLLRNCPHIHSPGSTQLPQPNCNQWLAYLSGRGWQGRHRQTLGLDFPSFFRSSGGICGHPLVGVLSYNDRCTIVLTPTPCIVTSLSPFVTSRLHLIAPLTRYTESTPYPNPRNHHPARV